MSAGKVNRNTHSVGLSTRQVTISSITPDGSTAVCIDKTGVEVRVPMYWQASKGQPPAVGENWILTQDLGQWAFSMIVASSNAPFSTWSGSSVAVNGSGSSPLLTVANSNGPAATLTGGAAGDHVLTLTSTHSGTTSAAELILMALATDPAFGIQVSGDTNRRLGANASGKLQWSSGTAAADAFIERIAAAVLKLTGTLQLTGGLYLDAAWTTKTSGFSAGWTGVFNYRLIAANLMVVDFKLVPGTGTDATSIFVIPNGSYIPTTAKHIPAYTDNLKSSPVIGSAGLEAAKIRIDSGGVVACFGIATSPSAGLLQGCGLVPLDI